MDKVLGEILADMFNMQKTVTGAHLDSLCGIWGICRVPGESDAALRRRMATALKMPQPDPITKQLFLLLVKLDLKSVREYIPAGWS